MIRLLAVCVAVLLGLGPGLAHADDYFEKTDGAGEMTFRVSKPRKTEHWILIGALGGGTVLAAGLGVLFQFSGDSKAEDVEAKDRTGLVWDQSRQDIYDSARFRRTAGFTLYGVAGGLALGTIIAFVATNPGSKLIKVGDSAEDNVAGVLPLPGGAMVTKGWSF
ncbi:MAG: hypothetical protein KJO07_09425 [Deltaproteobacteria bacterium]|jgi:hypothetical protein|nr:hypothetical protein [Deltaproteobacteria bacterium]